MVASTVKWLSLLHDRSTVVGHLHYRPLVSLMLFGVDMASETTRPEFSRRKALKVAVGAICAENGFSSAEESALETLTEMLQSCLCELGRSTKAFAELSFRTEPMLSDVVMAMVEMGLNVKSLPAYSKRTNKLMLVPPSLAPAQPQPRTLQVGQKKQHQSHIPNYLPAFPDPHTYTRTLTHKEPATEYQLVREKAASQKRDVERALTRFIAKTGETESLFQDDPYAFPLIANKVRPLPYLDALLPKDEDLESREDGVRRPPTPPTDAAAKAEKDSSNDQPNQPNVRQENPTNKAATQETTPPGTAAGGTGNTTQELMDSDNQIDNPYLRAIKMPKLKPASKKHKW